MAMIFHKIKSAPQIYLSEIAQAEIRQMTECAKYCINNAYLSVWSKKAAISSVKIYLSEIAQAEIRQMTECAKYCINNAYLSVWSKKAA
ncbi:hypothetical protein DW069_23130, partial [Bacteroides thetaiotaomicron]